MKWKRIVLIGGVMVLLVLLLFLKTGGGWMVFDISSDVLGFVSAQVITDSTNGEYMVVGDSVITNDSFVWLNVTPHTLTGQKYVNIEFESKQYAGDVDIVFLTDKDTLKPTQLLYYKPHNVTKQKSYTCDSGKSWFYDDSLGVNYTYSADYFNYTQNPNHFWCFNNETVYYVINGTKITDNKRNLLFEHDFDTANLGLKTAYWNEIHIEDYKDVTGVVTSESVNIKGMNKAWYIKNFNVNASQKYSAKVGINYKAGFDGQGKYFFGVKRSSDTVQDAITNSRLYYIDPWWNTSYDKRINITFDAGWTGINLVDFPVLVVLNSTRIDYADTNNDGSDLRFVDADQTTVLDYEIELWNESGYSYVWVRVPQIDSGSTTDKILLFYKNNTHVDPGENPTGVWNSNYWAVWHMNQNPSGYVNDSTLNNRDLENNGTEPTAINNSLIGSAVNFSGLANERLQQLTSEGVPFNFSLFGIVQKNEFGSGDEDFFDWRAKAGNDPSIQFRSRSDQDLNLFAFYEEPLDFGTWESPASTIHLINTWAMVGMSLDSSSSGNDPSIYYNGTSLGVSEVSTPTANYVLNSTVKATLGNREGGGKDSEVTIDEFRVSIGIRSPTWMNASYLSAFDLFNTYGIVESQPPSNPPQWFFNQTNSTTAGQPVKHSVYWTDDVGLSGYIFAWHNGINWSIMNFTGDKETANAGVKADFFAGAGGVETQYASSHITGSASNPDNANNAPDGTYTTDTLDADWTSRWAMANPSSSIIGKQFILVRARETANGNGDPTIAVNLYENGASVQTLVSAQILGDNTGAPVNITGSFDASAISNPNDVEIQLVVTGAGGGPNRDTIQVDSIRWNVTLGGGSSGDTEVNKTGKQYTEVFSNPVFKKISNVSVTVNITNYNTSGSTANGNTAPQLWLGVYNGTAYENLGSFGITGEGNYTLWTTTKSTMDGWGTLADRDINLTGYFFDATGSSAYDQINWTQVSIRIDSEQTFKNDSWVPFTTTPDWSNITKSITSTQGATIKWYVWANDTDAQANVTNIFSYTTTAPAGGGGTCWSLNGNTLYVPKGCTYYVESDSSSYIPLT